MGGPTGMEEVAKKDGQVKLELEHMRGAIAETEDVISALEERLSVALVGETPEKAGDEAIPEAPLCDLADAVRRSRREIQHRTRRLRSIIQRIEL